MTKPTCTCHPVPERYHTTHYGATEPGSTLEPDYGCPVHFPKVKREWGKAPAHVHRTPSGCWHWECRLCPVWVQRTRCVTGIDEAVAGLAEHQEAGHVDALFRGDRCGSLGMAMDRTSERSGA